MRILLTRPEPGAALTAERLRRLGHGVVRDPMLRIVETGAPLPEGPFDAVAFTSPNAARAVAGRLAGLPAFAVGSRTAAEARAAGFADVMDCAGDAAALARTLAEMLKPGARILHPAGEDRAADLAALLAARGLSVIPHIVYRAPEAEALGMESRAALRDGTLDAALHFSPRTVRALLRCVSEAGQMEPFRMLRHFCLSQAVAAPLAVAGMAITLAPQPHEEALLALLGEAAEVAPGMPPV